MKEFNKYPNIIYAGFWMRFFAYLLDLILVGSIQRMMLFFLGEGLLKTTLSVILFLAYFILMTKLNQGQTLGKMVFGLRVICFNEEELSWATVLVRELFGRYLQKIIWPMYLLVAFTPYKQHVIDMLADTSVVTENYLCLLLEKEVV
ncbi:putative integral inner membrane protein [Petrocella atlantisensis]|uniref:Putative integral inner membrane protein n=1 Tax=Petrocella atlantisensis TaxID=2173034 RepID=A0A3P7RZD2_9FIRM|nr:RDD family protein [Petrocella atlantisensis]VDN46059.1 putative integral inner membrane protein [Petrocella atlantisensis]